jgi:[ribosomal protein S18]-alanine N-acetyltransferase
MITVATAAMTDLREAAEIFAESFPAEGDARVHEQRFREELGRPMARITVARDEQGRIVGVLLAWHVVDEVTLLDVAVRGTRRREGHGRALVEALLVWAKEAGARLCLLEVRTSNTAARSLYATLGFEEVNVRRRYYEDGEDAVEMHATLAVPIQSSK